MESFMRMKFTEALKKDMSQIDEPLMTNIMAFEEGAKETLNAVMSLMVDEIFEGLENALGDERMVFDNDEELQKWI